VFSSDAARDLSLGLSFEWSDEERRLMQPLLDGTVLWLSEEELDAIARPLVAALWAYDLGKDIEHALADAAERSEYVAARLEDARRDLDRGPPGSRLGLAVVRQAAIDLTGAELLPGHCLLCVEEGLGRTQQDTHGARVAAAAAGLVMRADPDFGTGRPSDDERLRARRRLSELAVLGRHSLPLFSAALADLVDGDLPPVAEDEVWQAAVEEQASLTAVLN
jgi:hypothetical protein